jgi:beta-N-acetylhexosaminidase
MKATGEQTTLEDRKRRAGQRLILGLRGPGIDDDFRELVATVKPAGFILFARNVEEPSQVRELNRELASLVPSAHPALLSVDQEGGRVQRVRETLWPPMRTVGNVDDEAASRNFGRALADEVRALGFNVNWAPCADVDSNPDNPVIGDRAFGRSPEAVARHVVAVMQGLHAGGVVGCVKHFPGHGDTNVDSHLDLPVVDKDVGDIARCELLPFAAAVRAGVGMVMTAHVLFPAIDEDFPATMSSTILRGWLRERMGFEGIICSDDMEMKAVRGRYPLEQQLDLATRATVDLFLCCKEYSLAHEAWEILVHLQESDPGHDDAAIAAAGRVQEQPVEAGHHVRGRAGWR